MKSLQHVHYVRVTPYRGTKRRSPRSVVEFYSTFIRAHGYPPSLYDLMSALGLWSTETAHALVGECLDRGFLQRSHATHKRAVTVRREARQFGDLRLVWRDE
jgi:SOS-response transcriptional repressor LexA